MISFFIIFLTFEPVAKDPKPAMLIFTQSHCQPRSLCHSIECLICELHLLQRPPKPTEFGLWGDGKDVFL